MSRSLVSHSFAARSALVGALAAASLVPTTMASAAITSDPPARELIQPEFLRSSGTGCAPGTFSTMIGADAPTFSAIFDTYYLSPASPQSSCRLVFRINGVPANYTYAVNSVRYYGHVLLNDDQRPVMTTRYSITGSTAPRQRTIMPVATEDDGSWYLVDEVPESDLVWAPCGHAAGQEITLDSTLTAQGPADPSSDLGLFSIDLNTRVTDPTGVGVVWKRC